MKSLLIELHYLGSIQYFQKIAQSQTVIVEQYENYEKRSYRNRFRISGANGVLTLSIPLLKGKHNQQNIRDVKIAYYEDWQKIHWKSICSAYGNAPFFEHYADMLRPHFEKKYDFLYDFNFNLFKDLLAALSISTDVKESTTYEVEFNGEDYRNRIHPRKQIIKDVEFKPYSQVFESDYGFTPNLSVLDLLFCMGPESGMLL